MSEWNDVRVIPEEFDGIRRFVCKCIEGSMRPEETERIILGRHTKNGFRFMTSDWQQVTHWKPWVDSAQTEG